MIPIDILTAALLTATIAVAWQILRRRPVAAAFVENMCVIPDLPGPDTDPDDLDPSRGVIYGILASSVVWLAGVFLILSI